MASDDPRLAAYAFAKVHAAVDGAFPESLTWGWFSASWQLCADHIGLVYPAREIREEVHVDPRTGVIHLSHEPTGAVQFFAGGRLVATLPPNSPCFGPERYRHTLCCPALCCYCGSLRAHYQAGEDFGCGEVPPGFVMAVARVFAYVAENRGDVGQEPNILGRCGALAFLSSRTTYVA
jgi:hypothetical protein